MRSKGCSNKTIKYMVEWNNDRFFFPTYTSIAESFPDLKSAEVIRNLFRGRTHKSKKYAQKFSKFRITNLKSNITV